MNIEKTLKAIVFSGLFAIPFIPLIVSGSMFFPFITGKNFAFRIIVEIIFAAWLILALRDASYRPRFSWILAAIAAFVGILTLATIFGENPYRSFWANYERMEGLITHLHLFAYFLVIVGSLKTERVWNALFHTSLGVSIVLGVYGLLQLAGSLEIHQSGTRLDATFGNATYLAAYMLFHIFIALFFLSRTWSNKPLAVFYGASILLDAFTLYHTATRGAILGLLGALFLMACIFAVRGSGGIRKWSLGVMGTLVALVLIFVAVRDQPFVQGSPVLGRFAGISLTERTVESRFLIWNMSFEGFKEHPILGWGPENYNIVFNKYYDPQLFNQEQWFDRAHNVFFDWLIAGGVAGLLAYLSLFAGILWYLWFHVRKDNFSIMEKSILTGLLGGYFFHNIFVFDNITSYVLFFTVLAYVHGRATASATDPKWGFIEKMGDVNTRYVFPVLIAGVLVFGLYFLNTKPILASRALIRGLMPQELIEANLASFKRVFAYGTFGSTEAREHLLQIAAQIARNQSVPENVRQEFVDLAIGEMQHQIDITPADARYSYFLGSFLLRLGAPDEALPHIERTLTLSPQKQSVLFELGAIYQAKNDMPKALNVFKEAYELAPSYDEAKALYALTALRTGDDVLAREIMGDVYDETLKTDDRFINAYAAAGNYTKVAELWRMRIEANPTNYQYRLSLAASLVELERRAEAIEEIRKVIEANPAFKEQGEYYIAEIQAGRKP